jgi:hypothetical protein
VINGEVFSQRDIPCQYPLPIVQEELDVSGNPQDPKGKRQRELTVTAGGVTIRVETRSRRRAGRND